jgi:hypothetical protein
MGMNRSHFAKRFALVGMLMSICTAGASSAEENASNPLAAVNNTDIRFQTYDLGGGADQQDAFIDGAYMIRPDFKFKYEAHFQSSDLSGARINEFSRINLKGIYFPSQTQLNANWGMKTAIGLEWILDFGSLTAGTGTGSDQIAPFGGLAFSNANTGLTLIPLVQHYVSYNGPVDINQTAMRLIALQPFGDGYWVKADLKLPYDWTNDLWPASAELQLGKNIRPGVSVYGDLMFGLGNDRTYDAGLGVGLRFNY